jgi:hypothetical protein
MKIRCQCIKSIPRAGNINLHRQLIWYVSLGTDALDARTSRIGKGLESIRQRRVSLPYLVIVLQQITLLVNNDTTQEVDSFFVIFYFLAYVRHLLENFHVIAFVVNGTFVLKLDASWGGMKEISRR